MIVILSRRGWSVNTATLNLKLLVSSSIMLFILTFSLMSFLIVGGKPAWVREDARFEYWTLLLFLLPLGVIAGVIAYYLRLRGRRKREEPR